jgi:2-iminobutanoate/2-iminopropanoate deaminase
MKILKILLLTFTLTTLASAASMPAITTIPAADANDPYSQGTIVDLRQGRLLFLTGQVEDDAKTGKLHNETMATATDHALNNIEAVLKKAGTSYKNMVRCEVYLKDYNDWAEMNKEYVKRFPNKTFPARVAIQTNTPYRIEMACIAFVPDLPR